MFKTQYWSKIYCRKRCRPSDQGKTSLQAILDTVDGFRDPVAHVSEQTAEASALASKVRAAIDESMTAIQTNSAAAEEMAASSTLVSAR
jgi:methyl-accepting chemotaxis protein